jgi:pimeloyl-ACP methyl ester carboxylesterase
VRRPLLISDARPAPRGSSRDAGEDYGAPGEPDWREIDWQAHLHQREVHGRRLNYVDIGEGEKPAVVFVHGWGGTWQNWLENIRCAAADGRRVVAFDLPGHGHSAMARDDYTISNLAHITETLCEELGIGPAAVVGNSMGGFISADLALQNPERVERLVLVAAAGISTNHARRTPLEVAARTVALGSALTARRSRRAALRPGVRYLVMSGIFRHPSRIPLDLVLEQNIGIPLGEGFVPAVKAFSSYDFRDRLPEIGCPSLIIHGENDMVVPVEDADEFERLIPDARKILLRDTGHVPMMERPPTFNRLLMEFLREMGEAEDHEPAGEEHAAA